MNSEKGFTLLEVLIAVFILSIALLGLSSMNIYSIKYNDNAKRVTSAVALAQDKLEELKNKTFVDSALNDSNTSNNTSYDTLKSTTNFDSQQTGLDEKGNAVTEGIYTRTWNIAPGVAGAADPYPNKYTNTKLIVVIVSWTDQTGSNSVTLATMKGCKDFDATGTTCTG